MSTMSLRERHEALRDLREVSRDLAPAEVRLLHRIAASFAGSAAEFRTGVLTEFGLARAGAAPDDDDLMTTLSRALGRRSSAVWDAVARIRSAWPELATSTRAAVLNEIDAAIGRDRAGGPAEVALWREVLNLPFEAGRVDALAELRRKAAAALYGARYGAAGDEAEWSVAGEEWSRPAPDGGPPFSIAFEPGTAILRGSGEAFRRTAGSPTV